MAMWTTLKSIGTVAVLAAAVPALASDPPAQKQTTAAPACCQCCTNEPTTPGSGSSEPSLDDKSRHTIREQHKQFLRDTWSNP